jgi:glycosyltransferase involved in cell wall biosynthesis
MPPIKSRGLNVKPVAEEVRGLRIACVASVPFFLATQLRRQIEYLLDSGLLVTVITSPGPELAQFTPHPHLTFQVLEIPRRLAPWRDLVALYRLYRLFRRGCFIIVHSTTPKAGLLSALGGWFARVPIRLHTFTGQPWIGMHGPMRWASRMSDRLIGWLNTRCYADSASQRKFLIAEGILNERRISTIAAGSLAGVDLRRFDRARFGKDVRARVRAQLGVTDGTTVLLFIGRITREKGIYELLESLDRLRNDGSDVVLLLVGPMDDERGGSGTVARADLEGRAGVYYLGYREDPERYFAAADILCLPSYREGFGTVVIEAAAMGVPTVGTRINGLVDAVVDGETGILVEPRNADALIQGLQRLLEDAVLRERMGEMARQRAHERYSSDVVNAAVVEEYARLLQRARLDSVGQ